MGTILGGLSSLWPSHEKSNAATDQRPSGGGDWGFGNLETSKNTNELRDESSDDSQDFEIVEPDASSRTHASTTQTNTTEVKARQQRNHSVVGSVTETSDAQVGKKRVSWADDTDTDARRHGKKRRINGDAYATNKSSANESMKKFSAEWTLKDASRQSAQPVGGGPRMIRKELMPPSSRNQTRGTLQNNTSARPNNDSGTVLRAATSSAMQNLAPQPTTISKSTPAPPLSSQAIFSKAKGVVKHRATVQVTTSNFTSKSMATTTNKRGSSYNPMFLDDDSDDELMSPPAVRAAPEPSSASNRLLVPPTDACSRKQQQEESDRLRKLNLASRAAPRADSVIIQTSAVESVSATRKQTSSVDTARLSKDDDARAASGVLSITGEKVPSTTSVLNIISSAPAVPSGTLSLKTTTLTHPTMSSGSQQSVRTSNLCAGFQIASASLSTPFASRPSPVPTSGASSGLPLPNAAVATKEHFSAPHLRQSQTRSRPQDTEALADEAWRDHQQLVGFQNGEEKPLTQDIIDKGRDQNIELVKAQEMTHKDEATRQATDGVEDEAGTKVEHRETVVRARRAYDEQLAATARINGEAKRRKELEELAAMEGLREARREKINLAQEQQRETAAIQAAGQKALETLQRVVPQGPPTPPAKPKAPKSDSDRAKETRIQMIKARNARHRAAEKAQIAEPDDGKSALRDLAGQPKSIVRTVAPTVGTSPVTATPQSSIVSLNNAAGQACLAESTHSPTKNCAKQRLQSDDILPEDMWLVRNRDQRNSWQAIVGSYAKTFGKSASQNCLWNRLKTVRNLVSDAKVPKRVLDMAAAGHEAARLELNRMVRERNHLPSEGTESLTPTRTINGEGRSAAKPKTPSSPSTATVQDNSGETSRLMAIERSIAALRDEKPVVNSILDVAGDDDEGPDLRPMTSGKALNDRTCFYFFKVSSECWEEQFEELKRRRQPSPLTEEDLVHNVYQVQRREVSKSEQEDGDSIARKEWVSCGDDYEDMQAANTAAQNQATRFLDHRSPKCDQRLDNTISNICDDEGMMTSTMAMGKGGGTVQARVVRYCRTYEDGILPASKDGWVPKRCFVVKEQIIKETGDDMFESSKVVEVTRVLSEEAFTDFEHANRRAVTRFVNLTWTPTSRNLDQRDQEVRDQIDFEMTKLDADEDEAFDREVEIADGSGTVRVSVDVMEIIGPRN